MWQFFLSKQKRCCQQVRNKVRLHKRRSTSFSSSFLLCLTSYSAQINRLHQCSSRILDLDNAATERKVPNCEQFSIPLNFLFVFLWMHCLPHLGLNQKCIRSTTQGVFYALQLPIVTKAGQEQNPLSSEWSGEVLRVEGCIISLKITRTFTRAVVNEENAASE